MNPVRFTPSPHLEAYPKPFAPTHTAPQAANYTEDTFDTTLWPSETTHKGLMSATQFMAAVGAYTDQVVAIASGRQAPEPEVARKIAMKKVSGTTVDWLLLGAPSKFRQARRQAEGSEARRRDYINCGLRGAAAAALSPTIFVPIVCGVAGFAKGQKSVNEDGVTRVNQRTLIRRKVLKPMEQLLNQEAPIPLAPEHRARVRAFLDVCENNTQVARILKPRDTKIIEAWLNDEGQF